MADYRALARQMALRYGLNPAIFLRQIAKESGFNPRARSPAGAEGIAQFMPGTAASWHVNPWNPASALAGAARMDAYYLHAYGGDWRKVLAAYNAGPGSVSGGYWNRIPETRNYIASILQGQAPIQHGRYVAPGGARPLAGGGSGSPPMRGPTGNPAAALAALGLMGGGSLNIPTRTYPTALESIQHFIQAHQPATPAVSAPLAPAVPNPTAAPSPQALAGQLDTLHQGLLNHL